MTTARLEIPRQRTSRRRWSRMECHYSIEFGLSRRVNGLKEWEEEGRRVDQEEVEEEGAGKIKVKSQTMTPKTSAGPSPARSLFVWIGRRLL